MGRVRWMNGWMNTGIVDVNLPKTADGIVVVAAVWIDTYLGKSLHHPTQVLGGRQALSDTGKKSQTIHTLSREKSEMFCASKYHVLRSSTR